MKITVYKKISDSHIVRDIASGQTVAHALPDIDFNNAVIIINGTKAVPSYKLKDGDTVLIRLTPSDSAESFWYAAWAIFEPISYNIYSGVQAYKARKAAQEAQDELEKLKNQTNASNIDNRPFLAGATNTLATDKSQPYICGRHLFTPYLLGSPFYVIDGTDGVDQYVMEALECGFNSQIVQKVNIDDMTAKTFSDTGPQEGSYDFDSGSLFADGGKIEIAQDGKEFDTLTNLNNKVVSKSCNTQIPYDSKVTSGDDSYLTYTLDKHAKDVTVAISFPYGLYAYNDSSDKTETTVEIVPEYSLDGGKTYTEFTFDQKTVYDSTKVIQEEWKYRTSDFNDATAHKNAFANKDISGFSLYQVTVLSSEHADEYNSIVELQTGGYVVTGNIIKHASYESVYSNTFTRNVQKEIRFTAHHDFTLADYTTLQSTADKVILIRLRNKGNDDSKIKNQAYVLFYQSVCFDPNKSSTPAGILDDSGTAGLVSCKLIEDRERAYCTILGIKCKATKNNEDKLKKINIITQGVARTWDSSTLSWSTTKTATRNPAAWLLEAMTSNTHPLSKFDDSELDLDSFGDAYDYCANHKNSTGAVDPLYFDYVVSGSATKEDLLSKICDVFGGMLYRNIYGKYAVAIDCSKPNAIAAFSSQNVISVENRKTFSRRTDGLRIRYINSANDAYKEDTYLVMREVNGIAETINADSVIRDVTVNGITTYDHVVWYARRLMAIEALRPKTTTVEVGEEGIYYTPMSKILLQDDSLKVGISDGVIKTVYIDSNGTVTGAALKNPVTFEDGKTYGMIVNHITDTGAVPLSVVVTGNGTTNVVAFTTAYNTSSANYPTSGDTFSFGLLDGDSFGKITTPYIISSLSKTDTGYSLECVNYNEAIYETGKIPDYVSNVTVKSTTVAPAMPQRYATLDDISNITGAAGRGISSTTVTYQVGDSGTTAPTGTWTTEIPTPAEGQYLWTKIYIVYTDETNSTSYSVAYAPSDGNDGTGISSTAVAYQMGTSGTTAPTGTWTTAIPTLVQGEYLWTRTVFTYTDATTKTVYSVSYIATDGTDSTAITISDPASTTPETGMKYSKTYYGIYNGVWYKWAWSSSTTGYWTQASADTPPTPAIRYSFDEMPDLPDDSGATYKKDADFTTTSPWTATQSTLSIVSGELVSTPNTIYNEAQLISSTLFNGANSGGKIVKIKVYSPVVTNLCLADLTNYVTHKSFSLVIGYNIISFIFPTDSYNYYLSAVTGSNSLSLRYNQIYIGDGTTSQPVIDNISGEHNATGSGVVSVPGVSGKACQFLGYKAISLDLSAYASVQSWWVSAWLNIPSASFVNYKEVFTGSSGSYYRKLWWFISENGFVVSLLKTAQSNVTIPVAGIADGWHNVISQIVVNSSSETIVKVYLDGKLYDSMTLSQDFTDLLFSTVYLGGLIATANVVSGSMDDFQFGVGEITASQALGLYLQRASAAKLYTLADYNYDTTVSSWEIVSSAASFSKSRSGVVTPSSVTFSAKAIISSTAESYSGRFIIYTSTDGTMFTSDYTSSADESSHVYTTPSDIAAIRVELYKSGGTSVLVATKDYSVPYDASVKPQYLGIGLLADVSGLTTKAYTSATITDAGVITPNGATTTAVIPGDWLINYSAGTYRALGIYYWSGSAWTITSDSKYTSDGVIEDICRLNNGGILIPDWTVYVNLIADNLFSHTIKLTTKTISGVTYAGVFYGGDRFNADGSIADRSKNGFYFTTDGKSWCNLQSDDLYNMIAGTNAGLQLIAGSGNIGKYNTLYGYQAGRELTTGYYNTINGGAAGYGLTTGYYNTINGCFAGLNLTTGNYNTINGAEAGYNLATGYSNTINGFFAGHNLTTAAHCLCAGTAALGYNATWDYQINLNNRIIYLEFASDATQDTVYRAITYYLSSTTTKYMGAFGQCNSCREINHIRYGQESNVVFYVNGSGAVLTCTSGSSTLLGYPLQVMFIVPATPTNK